MASTIRPYRTGDLGRCVALHAGYYAQYWSFGRDFEAKVAAGMAEFIPRLADPGNGWWSADVDGTYVGSVAIDDEGGGRAHLRWFIVDQASHGEGVGGALMGHAVDHCRSRHFRLVYLDTFEGLDAARRLYERAGFRLVHEQQGTTWGPEMTEQRFEWAPS